MSSHTALSAATGGPSSMIFWCLRCTEQSRPLRAMASPYSSAMSCTSRCLLFFESFMMKIGEPGTSPLTCLYLSSTSSMELTILMPLPPPPSDALIMTGKPILSHSFLALSAVLTLHSSSSFSPRLPVALSYMALTPSPFQEIQGTPAVCAMMVDPILSPSACMAGPGGPMNLMPCFLSVFGRAGFSDACPHPAQTASTWWKRASSQISVTLA
mmetsp:Transcript_75/g.163  ORF Transcript_75/g.163 Transcript_75/m.163 type:complete len:213 (-) Transcript_75:438-1076(-)